MEPNEVKYNPWSTDESAAGLRNALLLAEKTGHVLRASGETDDGETNRLDDMPSIKMIKLQREISQHTKHLNETNLEIIKRMLYHETKDIMDVNVIEERTAELKKLSDHLQTVVNHKEFLITRLQQPFVGDYIKLEAAFHRYASEFFSQLAPILSELTSHLDNLTWIGASKPHPGQLDTLVTELSGALATLQTNYQSFSHMSQCIQSLHSQNSSKTSLEETESQSQDDDTLNTL